MSSSFPKTYFVLIFLSIVLLGCASRKSDLKAGSTETVKTNQTIVTPALGVAGHVASVNRTARFVVLSYPIGSEPPLRQKLNVYRNNLKVAELFVTGPQKEGNTVADIVTGEVQLNDEVRED